MNKALELYQAQDFPGVIEILKEVTQKERWNGRAWLVLGLGIEAAGDVNADGIPDVVAGAPGAGATMVYSGNDGRVLLTLKERHEKEDIGRHVADAGDVDGDGHDDLVIGAWQHSGAAPAGGKVYLFSGKDGRLLRAWTAKVAGETFGFDATGMGDVNGDGLVDLLLTSAWSAIRGAGSGRMFLISAKVGKPGSPAGRPRYDGENDP